ncbi:hypothetical protein J6590_017967 [Homalodisca vitripennis]|nr:hypothetical protein J6590_017967 [Homalodisca vitripennis]
MCRITAISLEIASGCWPWPRSPETVISCRHRYPKTLNVIFEAIAELQNGVGCQKTERVCCCQEIKSVVRPGGVVIHPGVGAALDGTVVSATHADTDWFS